MYVRSAEQLEGVLEQIVLVVVPAVEDGFGDNLKLLEGDWAASQAGFDRLEVVGCEGSSRACVSLPLEPQ